MLAAIMCAILFAVFILVVQLVALIGFSRWVETLPKEQQEEAWKLHYLLSCAETPEEQAMIMYHYNIPRKEQ
jgi:hypothetical protein